MLPADALIARLPQLGDHPRLLLTNADLIDLRLRLADDPWLAARWRTIQSASTDLLTAPPFVFAMTDDDWLLATSRRFLRHALWLGLAWRLTDDERYRSRLLDDLHAVSEFREWCPSHWLDVAEMSAGAAIAYDWLYPSLEPAARDHLLARILDLGLAPAIDAFFGDPDGLRDRDGWWRERASNWNQVCNGGIILTCLAVFQVNEGKGERFSDRMLHAIAERMVRRLLPACWPSMPASLAVYAPDGGYPEGTNYWGYGTSYTALTSAALTSALRSDNGLCDAPGLDATAAYPLHAYAPSGRAAWFGDSAAERQARRPSHAMAWLARRHHLGTAMHSFRALVDKAPETAHPLDLLWARDVPTGVADEPSARCFHGAGEVAFLRGSWTDPAALWAYLKAGNSTAGHGHLDQGSFELEALGERWVTDLGMDNYGLVGYWDWGADGRRWGFWRCAGHSHNLCLVAGRDLTRHCATRIHTTVAGTDPLTVADLTDAYRGQGVVSAQRGLRMTSGGRTMQVQDEFTLSTPATIAWGVLTAAEVEISADGRSALMRRNGQRLTVLVQAPTDGFLRLSDAPVAPSGERANDGYRRLELVIAAGSGTTTIAVSFLPRWAAELVPAAAVQPLIGWTLSAG